MHALNIIAAYVDMKILYIHDNIEVYFIYLICTRKENNIFIAYMN